MGACFSKVFNGCPLNINCTASWVSSYPSEIFISCVMEWNWFNSKVHPETHNQHILVGAEEGIYTLNLNELHENAMDLLYPRRTVWMFVIKDVVMTLSGKTPSLFRHDLVRSRDGWIQAQWLFQVGLHSNSKQNHRFTLSVNAITKIPEKFVPKKYSMTSKVFNHSKHCQPIEITITWLWVSISGTWHERVQQMRSRQEPLQWLQVPLRGPAWRCLPNAMVSNSGSVPVNPDVLSSCCWHSISGMTPWTSSCCWNTSNVQ